MNSYEIVVQPTDPKTAQEQFATFLRENPGFRDRLSETDVIRDDIIAEDGVIKHQFRIKSEVREEAHR